MDKKEMDKKPLLGLKPRDYEEALIANHGLITKTAASLGVTRGAVYKAMERHPHLREALVEARERMLDLAESRLFQAIDGGDVRAITVYLKTQGRHRGYVERQEKLINGTVDLRAIEDMSDIELNNALEDAGVI